MIERFSEFIEGLTESPQMVEPTEFGLDKFTTNQKKLKELLRRKKETIIKSDGEFEIFRTGNDRNGSIVLHDFGKNSIDYYIAYEAKKRSGLGLFVTQVKLWRAKTGIHAKGMTAKIFFDYLLNKYPAIMSDSLQTDRGKEFWQQQMIEAFKRGFKIGLADLNIQNINWFDGKTSREFSQWLEYTQANGWGVGNKYMARRFVISN